MRFGVVILIDAPVRKHQLVFGQILMHFKLAEVREQPDTGLRFRAQLVADEEILLLGIALDMAAVFVEAAVLLVEREPVAIAFGQAHRLFLAVVRIRLALHALVFLPRIGNE